MSVTSQLRVTLFVISWIQTCCECVTELPIVQQTETVFLFTYMRWTIKYATHKWVPHKFCGSVDFK